MTAATAVWAVHWHWGCYLVVIALVVGWLAVMRRLGVAPSRHQIFAFTLAQIFILVAGGWPVADLAAHWSLTALVVQRLVLMLGVPPLLVIGCPTDVLVVATRPVLIDRFVQFFSRPAAAIVAVTIIAVGTLDVSLVDAQSHSIVTRTILDAILVLGGFILWAPVLSRLPGSSAPSSFGRAGYLVVQSIVPSFLAVVWIFSHHPLYNVFSHRGRPLGIAPVTDQQIAGFVAKLSTIVVLWSVAYVMLGRAQRADANDADDPPLTWGDVERHLERVERNEQRQRPAKRPSIFLPPSRSDED